MNKKELNEIKKHFNTGDDLFVLNRVVTAVVDSEHKVKYSKLQPYSLISDRDFEVYHETLKNVISKKLNKNITEYSFTTSEFNEGSPQEILYTAVRGKFDNMESFINHIVSNNDSVFPYAIIAAHCTYTIFKKNKMDEEDKYHDEQFNFILVAFCPISSVDTGFSFNFSSDEFSTSGDHKLYISKKPSDGFMFPAFSERTADVNSVMYYTDNSKEPNISIIEDVLGCMFSMTAEQEKSTFQAVISESAAEYLNYQSIKTLDESIEGYVYDNRESTEPVTVDSNYICDLLRDIGVPEEKMEDVKTAYDIHCDYRGLHASNLVNRVMRIKDAGITINIKDSDIPVQIESSDSGRKLIITLPDEDFSINDYKI